MNTLAHSSGIMITQEQPLHATTVVGVIRNGKAALGSDGQVTLGNTVMKASAKKVRRLGKGNILAGFAGSAADAFTLLARFEEKLEATRYNLERSAVEFAKEWRTDRALRRLEAMLITLDTERAYIISGNGDVLSPDDNIVAVGSGGAFALSAARALYLHTEQSPAEIVKNALSIAGEICIYTNTHISIEEVGN